MLNHFTLFTYSVCFLTIFPHISVSKLDSNKVVVCYVGTWSVYRPGSGAFQISDINADLCTHLIYSFVGIEPHNNTIRSLDPFNDLEDNYGKGSMKNMIRLKKENPGLKVSLAVGGWNEGSTNYSNMALTAEGRKAFVDSALNFVNKFGFDGFDVDWEFPTQRGGRPDDRENFVLLLKELKYAFKKQNLILTAAINAGPRTIEVAYDVPEISKHLDFIHVMTYDYHGQWDNKVGPNAPLNGSDSDFDLESTIKYLLKQGAPAHKLVIGLATYGHTFVIQDGHWYGEGPHYIDAPTKSSSFQGPYTRQDGFMGYNEICDELNRNSSWQVLWDMSSSTPYAVNGKSVISYDNERSIALKVALALRHNLGGLMVWSIDTDDFRGNCRDGKYPLLRSINHALENYQPEPEDNNLTPSTPKGGASNLRATACDLTLYLTIQLIICSLLQR